jgi:hypothetical protein
MHDLDARLISKDGELIHHLTLAQAGSSAAGIVRCGYDAPTQPSTMA